MKLDPPVAIAVGWVGIATLYVDHMFFDQNCTAQPRSCYTLVE